MTPLRLVQTDDHGDDAVDPTPFVAELRRRLAAIPPTEELWAKHRNGQP